MFGNKKQVLIVGNDSLKLYSFSGKKIILTDEYPAASETLAEDLQGAFSRNKSPLLVLFDVIEQQYRREVIPPVSSLDKGKVIQRKLLMAFPQQEMRAFVPFKQKPGDPEGMTLLFAALGSGPVVDSIMKAVLRTEIFLSGVGLLPLESTGLLNKLVQKTHERARIGNDTRWSILMSYHRTGGLRQIVVKDGELALTRLTPISSDVHDTAQLTDEMMREFNSTLIYLSRFGYSSADGLDLIVISSPEICQQLRALPLQVTHLYPLTVGEATEMIGVSASEYNDSVSSDVLHAAWGATQKAAVPLTMPYITKIKSVRQIARAAIILLFLASCYLLYENTTLQVDTLALQSDIVEQNSLKQVLQHKVDERTKELNDLKYDPEKTRAMITLYEQYAQKNLDVEPFMGKLAAMMNKDATRIRNINISPADETTAKTFREQLAAAAQNAAAASAGAPPMPGDPSAPPMPGDPSAPPANTDGAALAERPVIVAKMTMSFDPALSIEDAANMTFQFAKDIEKNLPGFKVNIDAIVGNLAEDKTVQGESEQVAQGEVVGMAVKDDVSSFTMTGVLP